MSIRPTGRGQTKRPPTWRDAWIGMPEFTQEDLEPWKSIWVHLPDAAALKAFAEKISQALTERSRYVHFPAVEPGRVAHLRYESMTPQNPVYPVYVISKGRAQSRMTSKALERMCVPYHIVVEPQELGQYAEHIDREKILVLSFANLGKGSIPARNWVWWEHAVSRGAARHWILDDNIRNFWRLNHNQKIRVADGTIFRAAEQFVDRYQNVALAGFNYYMFAPRKRGYISAFQTNTRC